jgi:hypothetical protein
VTVFMSSSGDSRGAIRERQLCVSDRAPLREREGRRRMRGSGSGSFALFSWCPVVHFFSPPLLSRDLSLPVWLFHSISRFGEENSRARRTTARPTCRLNGGGADLDSTAGGEGSGSGGVAVVVERDGGAGGARWRWGRHPMIEVRVLKGGISHRRP